LSSVIIRRCRPAPPPIPLLRMAMPAPPLS
jgi:hypothetical protein